MALLPMATSMQRPKSSALSARTRSHKQDQQWWEQNGSDNRRKTAGNLVVFKVLERISWAIWPHPLDAPIRFDKRRQTPQPEVKLRFSAFSYLLFAGWAPF